ncbi:MAG TPA: ATP-binding cassette domain-containing protein [Chitinophagaceae bacterium]|nr:ATP-binding cassette domain-containing protein [Chitinophagaceae bacterium]
MISIKNIDKKYGERSILNKLTINFPKGKVTSLIGSNGTGKSTLLGVVSRLLPKDAGHIFVLEKDIANISGKAFAKQLSFLKQSNHTHIRLKVRELVNFGRFPYTRGKRMQEEDHQKVDRALQFMDLEEIADSYIDELSGGQRQRAYLALVLAQDTDYILLDEPLNNLDMRYSVQIMKILKQFAHEFGKTVIMIVHDINIAAYYSDYIAALQNGRIAYFGKTKEIIQPHILEKIFGLEFEVIEKNDRPVCLYFN